MRQIPHGFPSLEPEAAAALVAFSEQVATVALDGDLDASLVNRQLVELARHDLDAACLAWRQASNAARLAPHPAHRPLLELMAGGSLVATALHPEKAVAEPTADAWYISARGLLTTGVAFASHLLVEAATGGHTTVFAVPASLITAVRRPPFIGLEASDNAIVALAGELPGTAVVGEVGGALPVVEQPYDMGLTMGAVAVGAAESVLELLHAVVVDGTDHDRSSVGALAADIAAAAALVDAACYHAPRAGWWSRAAKLAATAAAGRACGTAKALLGAATYGAGHPLVRLDRGIEGLAYQAPTNRGAALRVAADLPMHVPSL